MPWFAAAYAVGLSLRSSKAPENRRKVVSVELTHISSEWDSVKELMGAMRAVGDDFEGFFDQTFSELQQMCNVLDGHEQCLQNAAEEHLEQSSEVNGEQESQLARLLEESRQQKAELEQQQALLETELEAVRGRAAQTDQLLAEQRKDSAARESQWAAEMKNMRTTLDKFSSRLDSQPAPAPVAPAPVTAPVAAPPEVAPPTQAAAPVVAPLNAQSPQPVPAQAAAAPSGNAAEDVVLDSVMAQFQMLQKDVARRRENTAG